MPEDKGPEKGKRIKFHAYICERGVENVKADFYEPKRKIGLGNVSLGEV